MWKFFKKLFVVLLIAAAFFGGTLIRDKKTLKDDIIRLHVVADSDSEADQTVKLQVRDAILAEMEQILATAENKRDAFILLAQSLDDLQDTANEVLTALGVEDTAVVTLDEEAFPTRVYDTFSLPAGVYGSLRVTIGSGEGKNWWCVVFPRLCVPAASEEVEDVAAGAGFSDALSGSLTGEKPYQIRFFILDCLGKLENFFRKG